MTDYILAALLVIGLMSFFTYVWIERGSRDDDKR